MPIVRQENNLEKKTKCDSWGTGHARQEVKSLRSHIVVRLSESLFLQEEGVQFDEPPMVLPNHEIDNPKDSEVPEAFKRSVYLGCVWLSCLSRKRKGKKQY